MEKHKLIKECKIHGLTTFNGKRPRCGRCQTAAVDKRRKKIKQMAVDLLGGCCEKCGYNKYIGALEFHHKDPSKKDFAIGKGVQLGWEKIKAEVLKCMLLCSNCHKEEHARLLMT